MNFDADDLDRYLNYERTLVKVRARIESKPITEAWTEAQKDAAIVKVDGYLGKKVPLREVVIAFAMRKSRLTIITIRVGWQTDFAPRFFCSSFILPSLMGMLKNPVTEPYYTRPQ